MSREVDDEVEKAESVKLVDQEVVIDHGAVRSEQGLPARVSLSPHLEVEGAERGVSRVRGSLSVEEGRGVVRSRSSSRKLGEGSPRIGERVLSRSPIRVEIGRRYDYPVEIYRRDGLSVGEVKRAYYYEDEVAVMRDTGDRFHLRSSPPVYRVDRREHVVDKGMDDGPMPVVVRRRYDYPEDGVYVEEENPRSKQVYYDGRIPHIYDSRKPVCSRHSPPPRLEREVRAVERVFSKSGQPMESRAKYEYVEDIDYDDEANPGVRRGYYYVDEIPIGEEEYKERKFLAASDRRELVENVKGIEEGSVRRVVELRMDTGLPSDHRDARRVYSTVDRRRLVDDSRAFADEMPSGKLVVDGYYCDNEKYAQSSRDVAYHSSPRYKYKDLDDKHVFRGSPSTSSGIIIRNGSPQDHGDVHSLIHDGHIRTRGEPLVSSSRNEYPRRPQLVLMDDFEAAHSHTDVKCHECEIYHSARAQHKDYLHHNLRVSGGNDSGYRSHDEFYENIPSYVPAEHRHRAAVAIPTAHSAIGAEGSRRILRNNDLEEVELDPTQKQKITEHLDMRVRSDAMKQAGNYLDPGYKPGEHVKTAVVEDLGMPGYKQAYRRPTDAGFQVESRRSSNEFVDNNEMQRTLARSETLKGDDHDIHGNYAKRKYNMVDDFVSMDDRAAAPRKWNKLINAKNAHDYAKESTSRTPNDFYAKRPGGDVRNHKLEAEQMFDEINHHKSLVKDDRSRSQGKPKFMQRNFVNAAQSGRTFVKGFRQPESSNAIGQSHFANRRVGNNIPHKVWERIRVENNKEVASTEANNSQDMESLFNFDPAEQSEDFKQMVHAEFLNFCKKLNENAAARKLYKEQGKVGSLFCIVCGRKNSKEFLNTQRLVTHAYMARKPSMRAEHLGLHKAISVLMGWNCVAAPDVVTWVPHILSDEESLAQKEDLILWPPVVIVRNISLSHNNHNEWDVISTDALGEFLRSKGFNQGKMTICLGNPGDQSVILVKFLGTFSGLREAERLHNYFSERKHGRTDLEHVISTINQNTPTVQCGTMAEKVESLLYGYMGISEDLDRMDYNTKKRCLVKSKKEIQGIADAPVKPGEAV
ncbi:hypothetical protein Drorol1_Dr00023426 [Drosera rotundifolia]